jgi:hypothetical protein
VFFSNLAFSGVIPSIRVYITGIQSLVYVPLKLCSLDQRLPDTKYQGKSGQKDVKYPLVTVSKCEEEIDHK